MRCLIDADVLVYELGFSGEFYDDDGEKVIREFEFVAELLDQKIKEIEAECWADEPSILFLTNDSTLNKMWNKQRKRQGLEPVEYKPNFRIEVAKSKPYKGQRKQEKPFHRDNIRAYMLDNYDVRVANGMEADDLLAIEQTQAPPLTTIICTRDKDLRMVEGMHFGWPCGKQLQYGPKRVDKIGELHYDEGKNKLTGEGSKFFYAQVLCGDAVDNYGGLPRCGPARAAKLLEGKSSEADLFEAVSGAYRDKYGDGWEDYFFEQADLAWMCREADDETGRLVAYTPPTYERRFIND